MSGTTQPPHDSVDRPDEQRREIRERFRSAWEQALAGGPAPDVEAFLAESPEEARADLRTELDGIAREYAERLAGGSTADEDDPGGTTDHAAAHAGSMAGEAEAFVDTTDTPGSEAGVGTVDPEGQRPGPPAESQAETVDPEQGVEYDPGHPSPGMGATVDPGEAVTFASKPRARGPQVPGYEVLGELGRGAMGVVYKARQVELDRLVALKMVLAGAHASPDQLARFHTEGQAIARMQHPHIVQIYEVGRHEDLPFFSLEYVDGGSLDRKIRRTPQPPREAARMTEVLARAMHAAHEHGVIHRDLKPGNVLLTADGTPKLTDFGLAKRLEGDAGQTRNGTIMGSPSYMAPEQARADADAIGPHSDVYGLGAILYELIAGRAPFVGASVLDVLQQVRTEEPVPPSRLVPKVPRDLETICLKCLHKDPHKRYASAKDLADDCAAFLEGRPIRARPVSAWERGWRWCRRNPWVAGLAAASVLLLLTWAGTATGMYFQIRKERDEKEEQRLAAVKAEKEEKAAKEKEHEAREQAERHLQIATDQNRLALEAIEELVMGVQAKLSGIPGMAELRLALLETARKKLTEVARSAENANLIDRRMAGANQKISRIFVQLGQPGEARKQLEQCVAIVEALEREAPDDWHAVRNLAGALNTLGDALLQLGETDKAEDCYRRSLALRERWITLQPDSIHPTLATGNSWGLLGKVSLRKGRPLEARERYLKSLQYHESVPLDARRRIVERREYAGVYDQLGEVAFKLGEADKSLSRYGTALEMRRQLNQVVKGRSREVRRDLMLTNVEIGDVYLLLKEDPARAKDFYRDAFIESNALLKEDPNDAIHIRDVARAHHRLGTVSRMLGEAPEVTNNYYEESGKLRRRLVEADPENVQAKMDLMLLLPHLGEYPEAAGIADTLIDDTTQDPRLLYHTAACYALCAEAAGQADAEKAREYRDKALATLRRAVAGGWTDWVFVEKDPDLVGVRSHPEFPALLESLKANSVPSAGGE